jgi:hypothetical protein
VREEWATATPVLSRHARQRCLEMGISTKVAKRIVQRPNLRRPGNPGTGTVVATSYEHPGYAVVFVHPPEQAPLVVTVLFDTREFTARAGRTFLP